MENAIPVPVMPVENPAPVINQVPAPSERDRPVLGDIIIDYEMSRECGESAFGYVMFVGEMSFVCRFIENVTYPVARIYWYDGFDEEDDRYMKWDIVVDQ